MRCKCEILFYRHLFPTGKMEKHTGWSVFFKIFSKGGNQNRRLLSYPVGVIPNKIGIIKNIPNGVFLIISQILMLGSTVECCLTNAKWKEQIAGMKQHYR
jgi:hypothetical protein